MAGNLEPGRGDIVSYAALQFLHRILCPFLICHRRLPRLRPRPRLLDPPGYRTSHSTMLQRRLDRRPSDSPTLRRRKENVSRRHCHYRISALLARFHSHSHPTRFGNHETNHWRCGASPAESVDVSVSFIVLSVEPHRALR